MQPASFREAPPVPLCEPPAPPEAVESVPPAPFAPVWLELLVQADIPERKAMPTTEQPKIKFCLRIAALLFAPQKQACQKSGPGDNCRVPTCPPRRPMAPGRDGFAPQLLDADVVIRGAPVAAVHFETGLNAEQVGSGLQSGVSMAGCVLEVGQQ